MSSMTLAVPDELKKRMNKFPEMNWSAVARKAFEQRIHDLEVLEHFASDSTLTEEDAIELGRKVRQGMAKKWRQALHAANR